MVKSVNAALVRNDWWAEAKAVMDHVSGLNCKALIDGTWDYGYLKAKKQLLPIFGPTGRIEREIDAVMDNNRLNRTELYRKSLDDSSYYMKFAQKCDCFIPGAEGPRWLAMWLRRLLDRASSNELYENKTDRERIDPIGGKLISVGTKLTKAILTLMKSKSTINTEMFSFGVYPDLSDAAINYISMMMADLMTRVKPAQKVKVVASIRPVDYLLIAAHTTGWRSCTNIYTGEYRSSCVSYLMDKVTVIAYAYNREVPFEDTGFNFPNKIWRQLHFMDKSLMGFAPSRSYPNNYPDLAKNARAIIASALAKHHNFPPKWRWKTRAAISAGRSDQVYVDGFYGRVTLKGIPNSVNEGESQDEDKNHSIGSYDKDVVVGTIGGPLLCAVCGADRGEYMGRSLDCGCLPQSESGVDCAQCGERIIYTEDVHTVDGDTYCPACYDDHIVFCEYCDTAHHEEDMRFIEGYDRHICDNCLPDQFYTCDICDDYVHVDDAHHVDNDTVCGNCFDESYTHCYDCRTSIHYDNAVVHQDDYYCKQCHKDLLPVREGGG